MTPHPDNRTSLATGFAAAARSDVRTLILGSLPGRRSIAEGEYYAHPRNVFWNIMEGLYGIPRSLPYECRLQRLFEEGFALWDVLRASRRRGSLDAKIVLKSAEANDLSRFLVDHTALQRIVFNGQKAAQLFSRFIVAREGLNGIEMLTLPSTSPANAALSFDGKLQAWRAIIRSPGARPAATGYTEV